MCRRPCAEIREFGRVECGEEKKREISAQIFFSPHIAADTESRKPNVLTKVWLRCVCLKFKFITASIRKIWRNSKLERPIRRARLRGVQHHNQFKLRKVALMWWFYIQSVVSSSPLLLFCWYQKEDYDDSKMRWWTLLLSPSNNHSFFASMCVSLPAAEGSSSWLMCVSRWPSFFVFSFMIFSLVASLWLQQKKKETHFSHTNKIYCTRYFSFSFISNSKMSFLLLSRPNLCFVLEISLLPCSHISLRSFISFISFISGGLAGDLAKLEILLMEY